MLNRKLLRGTVSLAMLVSVFASIGPIPGAQAINPATHNISTCAALNALGADASTNGDNITLTADLDCTSVSFVAMYPGILYTGVFNGNGHSISHLTINQPSSANVGLIESPVGATIKDLTLASGSVTGLTNVGSVAGEATNVTVTNVTSALNITGTNNYVGGLIGNLGGSGTSLIQDVSVSGDVTDLGGLFAGSYVAGIIGTNSIGNGSSLTLQRVSYSGTVTAQGGSRSGGLLGAAFVNGNSAAASLTIEDSYNAGTINTTENEVGGILGAAIATGNGVTSHITVTRTYNSGHVTGTDGVGGIFGIANSTHTGDVITIQDSFSVGAVTATSANGGGFVGANSADPPTVLTVDNSFYDGPGTGQAVCASLLAPTGTCTRINTATTPGYFKDNHDNAPLDTWDFAGTWTLPDSGHYPLLIPADDGDGISKAEEIGGPNGGDANSDGIADAAQSDVASFADPISGHYAVLQTSCGSLYNTQVGAESTAVGQTDTAYQYPGGLLSFTATGCTPGATATITQYFYGLSDPTQFVMRKWNTSNSTYTTIPGATFSTVTISTQAVLKALYQVTDGSGLDQDGLVDGNIDDPAGPAVNVLGVPNTGLGGLRH